MLLGYWGHHLVASEVLSLVAHSDQLTPCTQQDKTGVDDAPGHWGLRWGLGGSRTLLLQL